MFPNIPWKTAGGKIFWDTLEEKNNWKLQLNLITGHYRIIDMDNIRQAWGVDKKKMMIIFRKLTNHF